MLNYGSLFSGVEAPAVAWHPLGWRTRWVAEVERTACAVLDARLPKVPNLGDVTSPDFEDRAREAGKVDVVIGGSPCQAFSIAGRRGELSDPRGLLTLRYVEIINELDPQIAVWENVPGVLLRGRDNAFGHLLAALAGESEGPLQPPGKRWPDGGVCYGPVRSVAWRTVRAEEHGGASRRDRVLVVASARPDLDACWILFAPEGDALDPYAVRATQKAFAPRTAGDPGCGGWRGLRIALSRLPAAKLLGPVYGIVDGETVSVNLMPTLTARTKGGGRMNYIAYQSEDGPVLRQALLSEQERMMGFSGQWTEVPMDGEILSDTARAKLLGNSMSCGMLRWLGRRIEAALVAVWEASPDPHGAGARDFARLVTYRLAQQEAREAPGREIADLEAAARAAEDPEAFKRFRARFPQSTAA